MRLTLSVCSMTARRGASRGAAPRTARGGGDRAAAPRGAPFAPRPPTAPRPGGGLPHPGRRPPSIAAAWHRGTDPPPQVPLTLPPRGAPAQQIVDVAAALVAQPHPCWDVHERLAALLAGLPDGPQGTPGRDLLCRAPWSLLVATCPLTGLGPHDLVDSSGHHFAAYGHATGHTRRFWRPADRPLAAVVDTPTTLTAAPGHSLDVVLRRSTSCHRRGHHDVWRTHLRAQVRPLQTDDPAYRQRWAHFFQSASPPARGPLSELAAEGAQPATTPLYVDPWVYVEGIDLGPLRRAYAIYLASPRRQQDDTSATC